MRRVLLVALVASLALEACGTTTTKTVTRPASTPSPSTSGPATAPPTTTAVPPPTPAVYFEGVAGGPLQKPTSLELTVDGTLYVAGVQWASWGGATATGSGNAEYHGCTPNCAEATPHSALVAIRLSGIRTCSGLQYYSGVTLQTNSGRFLDERYLQRSWSPC